MTYKTPPQIGPSSALYAAVRAGFVRQGTTFNRWCQSHGVRRENARKALLGEWRGPKARILVADSIKASEHERMV
jgi:hypothetical protein